MSGKAARTEVVVVGAGFCGLAAAHELKAAGVDCLVLEARDRVGGRVEARRNGLGEIIDTGGQFICDDMPEVMALARAHGGPFVTAFVAGRAVIQPSPPGDDDAADLYARYAAIRDRMNAVDPDGAAARKLTVAGWLAEQPDREDAKQAFLSAIEGLWCQAPDRVPLWYLIENDRRITNEVPELQYFLRGTMQGLAAELARPLGGSLRLGTAATLIEHGGKGVTVHAAGQAFEAASVIIAVPPVTAAKIAFRPGLPEATVNALAAWKSGTVIKALLRYATAFWREQGFSGSVVFLDTPGLYACDASHDDVRPALVVFIGGRLATEWGALGEAGIREAVVSRLASALGPEAKSPLDMAMRDWSGDRWSGGGYSDIVADARSRHAEDVLRAGVGPVRFASSELSPSFPGYVEGAIVAGREAASKVIAELRS